VVVHLGMGEGLVGSSEVEGEGEAFFSVIDAFAAIDSDKIGPAEVVDVEILDGVFDIGPGEVFVDDDGEIAADGREADDLLKLQGSARFTIDEGVEIEFSQDRFCGQVVGFEDFLVGQPGESDGAVVDVELGSGGGFGPG